MLPLNCDAIDGIVPKTNGEYITNGLRSYRHTNVPTIEENGNGVIIINDDDDDDDNEDTSYRALDQLLASLALENDIMERHLSQINNNDSNSGGGGIKSKHSNQTTNGVFSFEITNNMREHQHYNTSNGGGYRNTQTNGVFDENLNDVLANLIEFTENEALPQTNPTDNSHHTTSYANGEMTNGIANNHSHSHLHHHHHHHHQQQHTHHLPAHFNHFNNNFNHNNHINSNYITSTNGNSNSNSNNNTIITSHIHNNHIGRIVHNYQEPSNNAIKRLTSESENSSSVSPSLSERSNGIVSWSDQVCCAHKKIGSSLCLFSTFFFLFRFFG